MASPPDASDLSQKVKALEQELPSGILQKVRELEQELRDWWESRSDGWGTDNENSSQDGGSNLWDHMPEIDSKEVARAAPLCEETLDVDFDASLIREGGYDSIDDLINDLIPKLVDRIQES